VDSVYIYWTEAARGAIGRAFLNGSNVNPNWLPVGGQPGGLAVDGRHIYWTNFGDAGQSTIGRAGIDGRNVDDSFITGASFDTGSPQGVAVDKTRTHIYWGNGTAGAVGRANLDENGDVSQIDQSFVRISVPSSPPIVQGVAVDSDTVFWADTFNSTLGAAAISNPLAPNDSFITGGQMISGVAVDNGHLYWTNPNDLDPPSGPSSSIGRADLNGQNANQNFIVLPNNTQPMAVAVDSGLSTTPPPSIDHLIQEVTDENLPHGTANSLLAKLEGAQRKVAAHNVTAACGSLGAYINEVQAQSGKKLDSECADALVLEATAVRESLGC
jgi:virginiamycin B lyase